MSFLENDDRMCIILIKISYIYSKFLHDENNRIAKPGIQKIIRDISVDIDFGGRFGDQYDQGTIDLHWWQYDYWIRCYDELKLRCVHAGWGNAQSEWNPHSEK